MPTYEYVCETCGNTQDEVHPAGERLSVVCDRCGGRMTWQFPMPALFTDTSFLANRPDDGKGNGYWSPQCNRRITSRDDVRRFCEEHGHGCEGSVAVKQREPTVDPLEVPYKVNSSIVKRRVKEKILTEHKGTVSRKKYRDMIESHQEQMGGRLK